MNSDLASIVIALEGPAARGDVMQVCFWLDDLRGKQDWQSRAQVAWTIGPVVPATVLDRLCELMPDASEPRLLRAAANMRCGAARDMTMADLAIAAKAAPSDPIPAAWAFAA